MKIIKYVKIVNGMKEVDLIKVKKGIETRKNLYPRTTQRNVRKTKSNGLLCYLEGLSNYTSIDHRGTDALLITFILFKRHRANKFSVSLVPQANIDWSISYLAVNL